MVQFGLEKRILHVDISEFDEKDFEHGFKGLKSQENESAEHLKMGIHPTTCSISILKLYSN